MVTAKSCRMDYSYVEKHERNNLMRKWKRDTVDGYLFILPSMLGFAVFAVLPVILSLLMSFSEWSGASGKMEFVGLNNYAQLFVHDTFWISLGNTLYFVVGSVPLLLLISLSTALLLNNNIKGMGVYRSFFLLPYVTSMVAVAIVFAALLHPSYGPINLLLKTIGISNPPLWLVDLHWAMPSVIAVSIWKEFGYYTVIFLAGLQGIPKELYEAATVDGANAWHRFRNVTLPMLAPIMLLCIILSIITSFKVFEQVLVMTDGGPGRATTTLVQFIYNESFRNFRLGYGSSAAFILLLFLVVITIIQYKGQEKWVNY